MAKPAIKWCVTRSLGVVAVTKHEFRMVYGRTVEARPAITRMHERDVVAFHPSEESALAARTRAKVTRETMLVAVNLAEREARKAREAMQAAIERAALPLAPTQQVCDECNGNGWTGHGMGGDTCAKCGGSGKVANG